MTGRAGVAIDLRRGRAVRWLTMLRERSPVPLLCFIGLGQSLSASALALGAFDGGGIVASTIGIVALLTLLRLMDEVKDLVKDRVAHPARPLPRRLLDVSEVRRAIGFLGVTLVGGSIALGLARAPIAGAVYAATVGYAFLMYREFFTPRLALGNAFTYAITHQVIIVPLYWFAVACVAPDQTFAIRTVWFALTGLGASFVLELCRKLDPDAHPILRTYLRTHGRVATAFGIVAGLSLLACAAYQIEVHRIVWPFVALVFLTLPLLWVAPRRFRIIEGASALLGLAQLLAPLVRHAWMGLA